ncbi:class I SAM-dependent methyltransferase [Virgibacillus halophilus]|uniref:Class I SAM-dependent methyltransferase n=1 Tax=Tigheibacillus halophilus TaxID=361280 RepID=A0ABU5CA20_9BACI|nr:class I SAM-dependent methyltransferase [Virgibacillus halophilus]
MSIDITQNNAENLPLSDNTIDIILAESIIAFTDAEQTIKEFRRVLKPGGRMLAIEVSKLGLLQPEEEKMICDFYGFTSLRTSYEWHSLLTAGGFSEIDMRESSIAFIQLDPEDAPDFRIDNDIETECFDMLGEHEHLTKAYQDELSYQVFRCK